ncbi:MAG TPA: C1 family peptidase, partial [Patescibacteria group bacterium]|nr:C1 family peptidase [Patescibacteria group bacterium]
MSLNRPFLNIICALSAVVLLSGAIAAQGLVKAPKPVYDRPVENFGVQPPPMDLSHLRAAPFLQGALQPASWDWRALGGVTSVKNQNPYGTCWAFGSIGDLESKVLITESYAPDYSELNAVACNYHGTDCNSGGWSAYIINYWTIVGSVDEPCNPYPGDCPAPTCINPACTFDKTVTEWREIPNDVAAIKNAVMTYGPVWTCLYASFPGFGSYNGTYCVTYFGMEEINHVVLIVGWDDAMCGGNGGWICKNSWGTGWGDNGYFYIRYGSARVGEYSSVIAGYKDYDPSETVYHWDELGWMSSVGYGDGDDWAFVEVTPPDVCLDGCGYLKSVEFWAVSAPTTYTIYVYDNFSGGALADMLAGPVGGSVSDAGYYTIDLGTSILIGAADPIYIVVEFNTGSYSYPIPYDDTGPMERNKSYVSDNGTTWNALDNGAYGFGDVGIRGRTGPYFPPDYCSREGDPAFYVDFGEDTRDMIAGETFCWTVGPCNFGFVSATCPDADTFCVGAQDTRGWTITADPPLWNCVVLDPGYLWWQDICITVPCDALPSDHDTLIMWMSWCAAMDFCVDCEDLCEDPNMYSGNPYYSADEVIIHIVPSPPALYILQDSLYVVEKGQTAAYVPFTICNGDACADPTAYGYVITSTGHVGAGFPQGGTTPPVDGGECGDVYGVVDA